MTNEKWWKPIANEMSEATFDDAMFWKERDFYISKIVAEAERRGYERAMEEVKKAIITTADALLSGGTENEERFEAVIIPKSFFEK